MFGAIVLGAIILAVVTNRPPFSLAHNLTVFCVESGDAASV
jgi:hypothetical protein